MNTAFVWRSPTRVHDCCIAGKVSTPMQRRTIMNKFATASILALTLAATGTAWAQTSPPAMPAAPPAATAPAATMDPAVEAKFKAADKAGTGFIEGPALEPYKSVMAQVDTNKDGKISRAEFAAAAKAGLIK
jgi:hypothetical protein